MNTNLAVIPEIPVQIWNGQRVVSNDDIGRVHHISKDRVVKAFQRHSDELVEGEDYFNLNYSQTKAYKKEYGLDNLSTSKDTARNMRVFTESGYLVLACTFRGPEAAFIRRMLVKTYFKAKDPTMDQSDQMSKVIASLQETINSQNKMLLAISETLDKVFSGNAIPELPAAKEETHAEDVVDSNTFEMKEGEATTAFLAERCRWYSTYGKPHVQFTEHVLRTLGIQTNKSHEYDLPYSRCVIREINGVVEQRLFIKPAGIQKLLDWCRKTDYARSLKKTERYQKNCGVHKVGDVKSVYYLLETNGVKGVCRPDKKRYNLKEF
jgi:hypothetical protein